MELYVCMHIHIYIYVFMYVRRKRGSLESPPRFSRDCFEKLPYPSMQFVRPAGPSPAK